MWLIQLVVILIVLGVLLWAVNNYIPMEARMKQIVNAVVIIAVVVWLLLWLLAMVGLVHMPPGVGPPKLVD
jgi:hypothetical protein